MNDNAVVRSLRTPESGARLATDGVEAVGTTWLEFAAFMRNETAKWTPVIKTAGI